MATSNNLDRFATLRRKYSIFLILAIVFVGCSLISPNFLTPQNLSNVSKQIAISTIVAFGQTLLIIAGMLDLAVGLTLALSGLSAVFFYKATELLVPSLFVGVFVGLFVSLITGMTVTKYKIPPFIATLGMLTAVRGVALLSTNGQNIYQIGDFTIWGQSSVLGIPTPVWFMVGAWILTWYMLNHTKFGRSLYAIGGNEEAARACGIKIAAIKIKAYLVCGAFTGLAGVLFMARVNTGLPNSGIGFELDTLSIAVIGGTSITGGVGSATGTLAGAFIIGFISNIMNLMAVPSYIQQIVKGVIIVVAVGYDIASKMIRDKKNRLAKKA
ncbi:MAG: ABC transporter permease [Propionivibrio sp.]